MKPIILLTLLLAASAQGSVSLQTEQSTNALAYQAKVSSTDLINNGQPTLSIAAVTSSSATFPGTGINDGVYANSPFAANTFFQAGTNFPATATYHLDVTTHPAGYDITSIDTFMGWAGNACSQANQDYTVEVSLVGSVGYIPLANVRYQPFSGSGGNYETHVNVTDTSGVLASGVDSIRFLFGDPGTAVNLSPGMVIREIDVAGTPSGTAPQTPAVDVTTAWSSTEGAFSTDVMTTDLVNAGQPSLSSLTSSVNPQFGAGGQNNGVYGLASTSAAAFYRTSGGTMPASLTFELNVASNPQGYVVTSIQSIAGWKSGGTQTYANQKYTLEYRSVGSSSWVAVQSVDYSPFSSLNNTPAITKVSLTSPSGIIATGVAALRFNFVTPTRDGGTNNGTVIQEIDVGGYAVGSSPVQTMVNSPVSRQIVQRALPENTGEIPVTGSYSGSADRIEARAVVMSGSGNSGMTTDWQTITASPSAGSFSGNLTGVPAGGWYQVEVRTVLAGVASAATVVERVGVGDVYVTAGQSNSANDGGPAYTPVDDRVSVRLAVTGSTWRHGYDPMPIATASGGSVWSRLGDRLTAAGNIPIGFICVGVGGTTTSQWVPGATNYDTRLKPAVQSFPVKGFRAVLWHQGETDSLNSTTAATYASRMASIIAKTREDSGWAVPWYMAEATFHPSSILSQEEPVAAGQRMAIYADPLVHIGPTTDSFHLEDANGGKLWDTVHFNAAGLADHANQWFEILAGSPGITPRNGSFEDNRTASVTGLSSLSDGAMHVVTISSNTDSPSVLGWRILTADGLNAADGTNGLLNPGASSYADAVDSVNDGVLAHMVGRHVAVLSSGSAGNHFLQTTRASVTANTTYRLTAALGVRNASETFGGARLEVLANGQVVATSTFAKEDLDRLRGEDSAGKFTDVSVVYQPGSSVGADQTLAIRIVKVGGTGTVLDFDNVRFATVASSYDVYQERYWGSTNAAGSGRDLDPDGDGMTNVIEYYLGSSPLVANAQPEVAVVSGSSGQKARYAVSLDPQVTETGLDLEYSFDLQNWLSAADAGDGSVSSVRSADTWTVEVALGAHPKVFFRLSAP